MESKIGRNDEDGNRKPKKQGSSEKEHKRTEDLWAENSVIPRMSGTTPKPIEILYKSSMQEVLERIKVLVFCHREEKRRAIITCLLWETIESWSWTFRNGKVSWQIVYEPSQHLPPETEKQMEGDLAGKWNLIYLHNAILMAPASSLHVSHHRAYPIHSAPGLLKPIHHPMASYLQGAWHTKLGLLSVMPATQAHTHNTHGDALTLCVLLQIGIVWSPGNLNNVCQSLSLSEPKRNLAQHMCLGPAWFSLRAY